MRWEGNILLLGLALSLVFLTILNESECIRVQKGQVNLVVGVLSAPKNWERRTAVRETWMGLLGTERNVVVRFLIGKTDPITEQRIQSEMADFGDVVRVDVAEEYRNLLAKTQAFFQWATEYYEFAFAMKVDDDSFLRVNVLASEIAERIAMGIDVKMIYEGFFHRNAHIMRSPHAKFYEPFENFDDCPTFLPYASGSGYLLSYDIMEYLARPPLPLRRLYNEDVAIGLWTSALQVNRKHRMDFFPEREPTKGICTSSHVLQHRMRVSEFYECFRTIMSENATCLEQLN